MRQDKTDALREKLRRGAERFDFGALIQGVSTLEEGTENPVGPPAAKDGELSAVPASASVSDAANEVVVGEQERLRTAVDTLGKRLLEEAGKLRAAFASCDPQDCGYYLARVNHVLELLLSVDPGGEVSRRLGATAAPPSGRTWPRPCWTVYDLAESPLSGLLPADAGDAFVVNVLAAAVQTSEG